MQVDWLIVGAGFTGSVLAERLASQLDQTVLVVERRGHIGGNAYDYYDEHGVLIHKYGPHIFHTDDRRIWDYLSQFTEWRSYHHNVLAMVEGHAVPVPFTLNSISALFPPSYAQRLEAFLLDHFSYGEKVSILKLRQATEGPLRTLADYVYDNVLYGYTLKQWGRKPEDLLPTVTERVPLYVSRDNRYFQDRYQGLPRQGYTKVFERMLAQPRIRVLLNTDYREVRSAIKYRRMIYSGAVDEFLGYRFGELPYRSLRFELQHHKMGKFQPVAQINYPNEHEYTRISEFKQMTGQSCPGTTVAYEYPQAFQPGANDPYYPIPSHPNASLYKQYAAEVKKLKAVELAGRLADYQYYNMDQAVGRALSLFEGIAAAESQ